MREQGYGQFTGDVVEGNV